MSTFERSWVAALAVIVGLTGTACTGGRDRGPVRGADAGGDSGAADSAVFPPPPSGGVSVAVRAVGWTDPGTLQTRVVVGSAADGTPAPLVSVAFTLETNGGAFLAANASSSATCPPGVSVGPGASLECTVAFDIPAEHVPLTIHYMADAARTASAPVAPCSPAVSGGLCASGQGCVDGTCRPVCSGEYPDGICLGSAERCLDGECTAPCSPSASTGWCDEGVCSDGSCRSGPGCPISSDYYPSGTNFCTSSDDLAAISRSDYGPDGDRSIEDVSGSCGVACLSDPDSQACTQACIVAETDASPACSACFTGPVTCAFGLCAGPCLTTPSECDACRTGTNSCGFDCLAGFYTCSGLPSP